MRNLQYTSEIDIKAKTFKPQAPQVMQLNKFPVKRSIWLHANLIELTGKAASIGTIWMANGAILNMLNEFFFLKPTLESLP